MYAYRTKIFEPANYSDPIKTVVVIDGVNLDKQILYSISKHKLILSDSIFGLSKTVDYTLFDLEY